VKWTRQAVSWLTGAACWAGIAVYAAVGHSTKDRPVAVALFLAIGASWAFMAVRRALGDARSQPDEQQ